MDVNGAKALKERLGANGAEQARAVTSPISDDAPPVYHWLGVGNRTEGTPAPPASDAPLGRRSWLRRLAG